MQKLHFTTDIQAPAEKVYKAMLGLNDIESYKEWTAAFNPTSSWEGSWDKGSKIYFIGLDENFKKGGMDSQVEENKPAEFVSIRHYGYLDGDQEITTGEEVEKWAGGHENYTFEENNGVTKVTVDLDTIDEYVDYFQKTYPKALEILKKQVEK